MAITIILNVAFFKTQCPRGDKWVISDCVVESVITVGPTKLKNGVKPQY